MFLKPLFLKEICCDLEDAPWCFGQNFCQKTPPILNLFGQTTRWRRWLLSFLDKNWIKNREKPTSILSNETRPFVILFNVIDIVNHINNTQHLVSPDGLTKKL